MESLEKAGYTVDLYAVGKKGVGFFKYLGRTLAAQRTDVTDNPTPDHAAEIMAPLIEAYSKGELASVDLVYAAFISPLTTPPTTLRILPVEPPAAKAGAARADYILRPDAAQLLDRLLPLYVRNTMYRGLVETSAAEHGGAAHRHEERHRQRGRDPRPAEADVQPPAPGGDHAGNRRDRRRRRGAPGINRSL